jgi:hypothetical protein
MSIKSTWQRWPTRCDRIIFSGSRFDFLEIFLPAAQLGQRERYNVMAEDLVLSLILGMA